MGTTINVTDSDPLRTGSISHLPRRLTNLRGNQTADNPLPARTKVNVRHSDLHAQRRGYRATMKWLALGTLAIALSSCAAEEADMGRIERQIAFQMRQQGAVKQVRVDCPTGVDWKPGETFDCTAFGGGQSAKITVLMEDDLQYEWTP